MENEIETKQQKVVRYFIENPKSTIEEISSATGVSKSSCQRYLNLPGYSGIIIPTTGKTITEQLNINRLAGRKKGGRTTFLTHVVEKDMSGKFVKMVRDENGVNKEEKKREDIIRIVRRFSQNPYTTLDELALYFDKIYTPDYIYDCLTDTRVEELFGKLLAHAITQQLSDNRYGLRKKFGDKWGDELFQKAGLSEREIEILNLRFSDNTIHSAEEVAFNLEISRQMVLKIEDRALRKLEAYERDVKKK